MRYIALGAMGCWAALIAMGVTLPGSAVAQGMKALQDHDVHFRIETARTAVRVGEPIMVRLTLVKKSSSVLMIPSGSPSSIVSLFVSDEDGNQVSQTLSGESSVWMGKGHDIPPGRELVLLASGKEWADLRDWGFDLRAVGKYTISAKPIPSGANVSRESGGGTSDVAQITILR